MRLDKIFIVFVAFLLSGCGDESNIKLVKEQKDNFFKGKTFNDVLSNWKLCDDTKWDVQKDTNKDIVRFTCINKDLSNYKHLLKDVLIKGLLSKENRNPTDQELATFDKTIDFAKVQEVVYFNIINGQAIPYKSGVEYYWKDGTSGYEDIYIINMFSNAYANIDSFYNIQMGNYTGDNYIPARFSYIVNLFKMIRN